MTPATRWGRRVSMMRSTLVVLGVIDMTSMVGLDSVETVSRSSGDGEPPIAMLKRTHGGEMESVSTRISSIHTRRNEWSVTDRVIPPHGYQS